MTPSRGFLDSISAGNFKVEDGRTIYFPYGRRGQGYVMPSREIEEAIRARLRRFNAGLLFAIVLVVVAINLLKILLKLVFDIEVANWVWFLATPAGVLLAFSAVLSMHRRITADAVSGLEVSGARWSMGESLVRQAGATPRWQAWLQVAGFAAMSLGGAWLVFAASTSGETMLTLGGLGTLAISLPMLAVSIYILRRSVREPG
jgi:hypothetical protein